MCVYLFKLCDKPIILLLKNNSTNICSGQIFDSFYEWLPHAMWKGPRKLKRWVELNVLCNFIVDQDHQRWVIALDHLSKSEDICSLVNPLLMGYETENGATLQELLEKSPISGKKKKKFCWKLRERKVKN